MGIESFAARDFVASDLLPSSLIAATAPGTLTLVKGSAPAARSVLLDINSPAQHDAATLALLEAMTVRPSSNRIALIDSTILSLKSSGLWAKMALFYVLAAHDGQAALLNWVNPAVSTLIPFNSPVFTQDRGYKGDGSSSYLDTDTAETALSPYAQNAAHAGAWTVVAASSLNTAALGTNGVNAVNIRTDSANRAVRINSTSNLNVTTDGIGTGHVVGVRRDAANLYSYRNGAGEATGAAASQALVSNTVTLLKANTTFADGQVGAAHIGDQLSAAEVATLYSILRTYMTAVGVP